MDLISKDLWPPSPWLRWKSDPEAAGDPGAAMGQPWVAAVASLLANGSQLLSASEKNRTRGVRNGIRAVGRLSPRPWPQRGGEITEQHVGEM